MEGLYLWKFSMLRRCFGVGGVHTASDLISSRTELPVLSEQLNDGSFDSTLALPTDDKRR